VTAGIAGVRGALDPRAGFRLGNGAGPAPGYFDRGAVLPAGADCAAGAGPPVAGAVNRTGP